MFQNMLRVKKEPSGRNRTSTALPLGLLTPLKSPVQSRSDFTRSTPPCCLCHLSFSHGEDLLGLRDTKLPNFAESIVTSWAVTLDLASH